MSLFKCLFVASLVSQTLPAAHGEAHCPRNVASLTLRLVQGAFIVVRQCELQYRCGLNLVFSGGIDSSQHFADYSLRTYQSKNIQLQNVHDLPSSCSQFREG
jgi:hypothetical protein